MFQAWWKSGEWGIERYEEESKFDDGDGDDDDGDDDGGGGDDDCDDTTPMSQGGIEPRQTVSKLSRQGTPKQCAVRILKGRWQGLYSMGFSQGGLWKKR